MRASRIFASVWVFAPDLVSQRPDFGSFHRTTHVIFPASVSFFAAKRLNDDIQFSPQVLWFTSANRSALSNRGAIELMDDFFNITGFF